MDCIKGLPLEIEQRLQRLASLQPDWDSYGASPPCQLALEKTRELLTKLYSLNFLHLSSPFIAPDPEGGLGLEWDFGPQGEINITISSEGQMILVDNLHEEEDKGR